MAAKKKSNPVVIGILLLLMVGLAGFGATNFGGSVGAVATVGDTEIDAGDYARAVDAQLRALEQTTGQRMTFAQAQMLGIDQIALSQLVQDAALENETAALGLSVGDEAVAEQLRAMPVFQGLSGEFDRDTYLFTLRQNGIDPGEFEERLRADAAAGILVAAVTGGITPSQVFTDTLFAYAREARDVSWLRLDAGDLDAPLPEPTDEELRAFFEENAERFTRPETRVIDYALLTPEMIAETIEVDPAQIEALFLERLDEFVQPERRLVERLVYPNEDAAREARARLDAGTIDFDGLIAERGLTLDDVDLGDVARDALGAAGDAIFALEEPGVVGPLPSPVGPALFRMNAVLDAQEITLAEASEGLRDEAAADRARRIIADESARIEDLLAGGADTAALAERTDMEPGRIEWNEEVSDGIAAYSAFRDAAAALETGGFPELVELEDGGIAVLSLAEIRPPAIPPLEDVREEVRLAWENAATENALAAKAEALAAELETQDWAALGLTPEIEEGLERNGFVEGTPPDFVDTAFDMTEGERRVLTADGAAWLLRLDAVTAPDPDTPDAQVIRRQFADRTASEMADALRIGFTQSVLGRTEVQVNSQALNAVNSQLP